MYLTITTISLLMIAASASGLSSDTCLYCSVQESWWKLLNVRKMFLNVVDGDSNGSAVAHLGQYGAGVHMKITDEMVPCPVCGWMRDHTSLSWSKWALLLTCWNNHSESLWRLWVLFHRTVLMYYNRPLPFNEKKARNNKVELLLTTISFPLFLCLILGNFNEGWLDWKGREKV